MIPEDNVAAAVMAEARYMIVQVSDWPPENVQGVCWKKEDESLEPSFVVYKSE